MGVEPKIGGKPPKWMVKIRENPMNKWDDLGNKNPLFLETPMCLCIGVATQIFLEFSPGSLGMMIQFDEHIFQMG